MGSYPAEQQDSGVDRSVHGRHDPRQAQFCLDERVINALRDLHKPIIFVAFPGKGLYHAHARKVFFNSVIEAVIPAEYPHENRMDAHPQGNKD